MFLIGWHLRGGHSQFRKPALFAPWSITPAISLLPLINTVLMTALRAGSGAAWASSQPSKRSGTPPAAAKLVKVNARRHRDATRASVHRLRFVRCMLFFDHPAALGLASIMGRVHARIVKCRHQYTTEEALIAMPDSYREGDFIYLGAGQLRTVFTDIRRPPCRAFCRVVHSDGAHRGRTAALICTASSVAKIPTSDVRLHRTRWPVRCRLLSSEAVRSGQTYGTTWCCWCERLASSTPCRRDRQAVK